MTLKEWKAKKEKRAAALFARAARFAKDGNTRLAVYVSTRAEDVLTLERRGQKIRPTSLRWPSRRETRSPYDDGDDAYRAGRSAENFLNRLARRYREEKRDEHAGLVLH